MATLIESVISCTLPVSGLSIHKDGHDYHYFSNWVKNVIIQLATSYPTMRKTFSVLHYYCNTVKKECF